MSKRAVILGGKESGIGAALLAQKIGDEVFVSDFGKIPDNYKEQLNEHAIPFEEGQHSEEKILQADYIIKSPGIPKKALIIQKAKEKSISILSEIEFAAQHTNTPIIAITGSNGKTTTTKLITHLLETADITVEMVGNVGTSFAMSVASDKQPDYYVIEVSSFQLDDILSFRPFISILLNITADHLDEYENDIHNYADAKWRITENQTETDYLIAFKDDPLIHQLQKNKPTKAQYIEFSLKEKVAVGAELVDEQIEINNINNQFKMNINELALKGKHNVANSMAAATSSKILNIKNEKIRMGLSNFEAVEHRLEPVLKIHGINFINDSKATNVNAVYYALESLETPAVWIVGGKDKGNEYQELIPLVQSKVKAMVCLGVDNTALLESFSDIVPQIIETQDMGEAVRAAYMMAKKGETVLLSPANASFDLFENYEDRGNQFKEQVRKL